MTLYSQNNDNALVYALIKKLNELQTPKVSDGYYHRSRTSVSTTQSFQYPSSSSLSVTAANATDLDTSVALSLNLQGVLAYHFADTDAHLIADTVNTAFDGYSLAARTEAQVVAFANAAKVNFNAHLSQSGVHVNNDPNTVATANATNQASANTLLNALKSAANTHMGSAPLVGRISINIPQP